MIVPEVDKEHTPEYMLKIILDEVREKRKENENLSLKVEHDQKLQQIASEQSEKISELKLQMKHMFNLDLKNLKLTYEHQLKQVKISMKRQEEEIEELKGELVKRESEIGLLREKSKYFDNEKKVHNEHTEYLTKVNNSFHLINL